MKRLEGSIKKQQSALNRLTNPDNAVNRRLWMALDAAKASLAALQQLNRQLLESVAFLGRVSRFRGRPGCGLTQERIEASA